MALNFSKNILYTAGVPIKQSNNYYQVWYEKLSKFLYSCLRDREVSFLSHYSPDSSIGNAFCSNHFKIKTFDGTFFYYFSTSLSKENIELLVRDEEFYLGNIIVIKGSYNIEIANMIAINWSKELIASNKEIFRMGNDGYDLYCYNISDLNFDSIFREFIDNLNSMLLIKK